LYSAIAISCWLVVEQTASRTAIVLIYCYRRGG
jgi:hypothetical protein